MKHFPEIIKKCFSVLSENESDKINEINITVGQPITIRINGKNLFIGKNGLTLAVNECYAVKKERLNAVFDSITNSSHYAYSRFINDGFLTIDNGHRVGVIGDCIVENDKVVNVCNINSLSIRIARNIDAGINLIFDDICFKGTINNTIIISPPGCGKTTFLRNLAKRLSEEYTKKSIIRCSIIDERYEIAACKNGESMLDIGLSSSVISGCKKSIAIPMVVRSMTPDVIITDELATYDDTVAIKYAGASGCKVIATTHGYDEKNNELAHFDLKNIFDTIVVLSSRNGPGTIEKVIRGEKIWH